MAILIVEDDPRISTLLERGMREEGYQTLVVADGAAGLFAAMHGKFDAIVLDLMLPRLDGFDVARRLRKAGNQTPILMLTARDEDEDAVRGLDLGADDYLTKPFSFSVFLAHLRAVLRRGPVSIPAASEIHDLHIDRGAHRATRGGQPLSLTVREFRLLEFLARNSPRVVTRQSILEEVWGFDTDVSENNLEAFVSQLRAKVDAGRERKLIHTVRGVGYCLREQDV